MSTSTLGRFGTAGFLRTKLGSNLLLSVVGALRAGRGLSAPGAEALAAAVEALVPPCAPGEEPKAVSDLAAVIYRAQRHLYAMAQDDRRDLCTFLELLEWLAPPLAGAGRRFSRLPLPARARCLAACQSSSLQLLSTGEAALRHLALLSYLETPEAWPAEILAA